MSISLKAPLAAVANDIEPVTPSDSANLPSPTIALYIEGAGDVVITTTRGQQRTVNVAAFSILPVSVLRVHATGTTATGIHSLVKTP